ncbi:uncharacterized photosystem II stability/assembly factor-like protein [Chthonomonas calidirosea]|uniref:Uncharacterized protein related to plant photosystem II stability/assembly factor n=1 Tax=Chthonomonas calidirosea (strain DSM 23976 / ICMP 18418 / T49) TaxID=1303518 RepID=S0EUY5_CHTCT|nr:Uncharacterized protein related to plant photosystem II stability/assembly factor [Chthonomonas calidirosea T49]CEK19976.1 uncharacterized photosystem II stability/assembly factor-like protein [Chthonomonas calidirosea]
MHPRFEQPRSKPLGLGRALLILCLLLPLEATSAPTDNTAWIPVPLITKTMRDSGVSPGGEGAQMIRTLVISQTDPNFLMMGTDVGGIYRTLDGGKHWQVCMVGWYARGGNYFAIDPRNADRVLGTGGNSNDFSDSNGLYLSTNRGASWQEVLPRKEGNDGNRISLAYDPSSYDSIKGFCKVAYFDTRDGGLYKTTDGGTIWTLVNADMGDMNVAVHPTKGFVYLAGSDAKHPGLYRSEDGGQSFQRLSAEPIYGICVILTRPNYIYIARKGGVFLSTDEGQSFHPVGKNIGLPTDVPILSIAVSPADPNEMSCLHGGQQWWEHYVYYSQDGGNMWHKPTWDNTLAFLPFTQPDMHCAYSPSDPRIVYSDALGGWVVRSTDGGATYHWWSNGENAVMVGSSFNFSPTAPGKLFTSFQDYNAAVTLDDGFTWTYCNVSGQGWGGFEYGGYTPDGQVMWSGDAPSWTGPRTLKISYDGGKTWQFAQTREGQKVVFAGADVSYSDPTNPSICFASNWRSTDRGRTWAPMQGCDGVYIANPLPPHQLFGKQGNAIVFSIDHGLTWHRVAEVPGGITDLAYDGKRHLFWVVSADRLKCLQSNGTLSEVELPKDQYGNVHAASVALDPGDPNNVYVGCRADLYACTNAVIASFDGGRTWQNLTVHTPLRNGLQPGGPHETQWLRVDPKTRMLWVGGQCYGFWKYPAPHAAVTLASRNHPKLISQARNRRLGWCSSR